jgi:ABC-type amino acid transport substrate-binding protein
MHLKLWGLPMPPFIGQAILLCFILLLATPTWAQTQTSDTLHKIKKRGVIRLGYRENSVPFSFLVDNQPIGYSIDLCNAIVKEIGAELGIEVRVDRRRGGAEAVWGWVNTLCWTRNFADGLPLI